MSEWGDGQKEWHASLPLQGSLFGENLRSRVTTATYSNGWLMLIVHSGWHHGFLSVHGSTREHPYYGLCSHSSCLSGRNSSFHTFGHNSLFEVVPLLTPPPSLPLDHYLKDALSTQTSTIDCGVMWIHHGKPRLLCDPTVHLYHVIALITMKCYLKSYWKISSR